MKKFYPIDPPFRTKCRGLASWMPVEVVGYSTHSGRFVAVSEFDDALVMHADNFDPQPQVPEAARPTPKPGEVWWLRDDRDAEVACVILSRDNLGFGVFFENGRSSYYRFGRIVRPATPDEASPFRDFATSLLASLGD